MKRRDFIKLACISTLLPVSIGDLRFKPEHGSGAFIELVSPNGHSDEHDHSGCLKVFSGDWNEKNVSTVKKQVKMHMQGIVPEIYRGGVKFIIRPPFSEPAFFNRRSGPVNGTIGWKYTPQPPFAFSPKFIFMGTG